MWAERTGSNQTRTSQGGQRQPQPLAEGPSIRDRPLLKMWPAVCSDKLGKARATTHSIHFTPVMRSLFGAKPIVSLQ